MRKNSEVWQLCSHCRKRSGDKKPVWGDHVDNFCGVCYAAWVDLYSAALGECEYPDVPPAYVTRTPPKLDWWGLPPRSELRPYRHHRGSFDE